MHAPNAHRRARGFTLIEVMITAAIIAVLAVLAGVGYSRYTRSARMAEATNMIATIKAAQENYFSQTNRYFDVSNGLLPPYLFPAATPGASKQPWTDKCTVCTDENAWQRLGVKATEPVWFGYATVAGDESTGPGVKGSARFTLGTGTTVNWPNYAPGGQVNQPWYIVTAMADANGNNTFAKVATASFMAQVITENDGE